MAKHHTNEYWGEANARKREDVLVLLIFLMRGNRLTWPETSTGYSYLPV